MYLNDINRIDFAISYYEHGKISNKEQECHLTIDKQSGLIMVDCSHQSYITKLLNSDFFKLDSVVVSSNSKNNGFICSITGSMPLNGITIRSKMTVISEEEKKRRSERALTNLNKRR